MAFLQRYSRNDYERYYAAGYWSSDHLLDTLADHVAGRPDAPAVVDGDQTTSWAGLDRLVDAAAQALTARGIGTGDVVGVQLPNSLHLVVVCLALLRIGAVYNPVNPSYRLHDVTKIYRISQPKLHIYTPRHRNYDYEPLVGQLLAAPGARFTPFMVDVDKPADTVFAPADTPARFTRPDPDAIYLLGSTSGSTGDPKIYMHTQNSQFNEARFLNRAMGLTAADRILVFAPMTHRGGFMWGFMQAMASGATLVIQREFDPADMIDRIVRYGVTSLFAIPNQVVELLTVSESRGTGGESLRVLMMAGAPVLPEIVARLKKRWPQCAPVTGFGSSETGFAVVTRPDYPLSQLQTCGKPLDGMEITVDRSDAPKDRSGELLIRGPFVFAGYYDNQPGTDAACDRNGWFRTGDRGYLDKDGNVIVTGRNKNVVIRSGLNIQAEEVEAVMMRHPAISHVVVVGKNDLRTGERAIACLPATSAEGLTLTALTGFLDGLGVAKFKWPEGLVVMDELPLNAAGKFDRIRLREMLRDVAIEPGTMMRLEQRNG